MRKIFLGSIIIVGITFAGCYTVLLTSSEATDYSPSYNTASGSSISELDYNQNCTSCHSQAELDDRYFDMNSVGLRTAHGLSIDPYGWRNPTASVPWWNGIFVVQPQATITPATHNTDAKPTENTERLRTSGNTRGDEVRARTTTATSSVSQDSNKSTSVTPATSNVSSETTVQKTKTEEKKETPKRRSGSTRGNE